MAIHPKAYKSISHKPHRRPFSHLIELSLSILLLFSFTAGSDHKPDLVNPGSTEGNPLGDATPIDKQLVLPYIPQRYIPPLKTVFGVGTVHLTDTGGYRELLAAGTSWMRFFWYSVLWSEIESSEGTYQWDVLRELENDFKIASSNQVESLVVVYGTPNWAQQVPEYTCGPIQAEKLDAFADFMYALVSRYHKPPFNVRYWEIWNEPDVDPSLVNPDSAWGCWGDAEDEYYGGRYFGEMLSKIYPRIKEADPQAQVIVGGMIMDCDPDNPPTGKDCTPSRFPEGILQNGGGTNFDGVAYHAYDYYGGSLGRYSNPSWHASWKTTGTVSDVKAGFLEDLLGRYGVSGKYLMNTENALLCDVCSGDATFETTKAYYLAQAYAGAIANGLEANIWHYVFDWRNSGLLNRDLSPRPAYTAFEFGRRELGRAVFRRDILEYPGVKGYEFERGSQLVWLVWSLDGETHAISLPGQPQAVYDALGNAEAPTATLSIDLTPRYIEFPP